VLPLLLMLLGGGRSLEDLRQIRNDTGLCGLLGLDHIPSTDAVGDWLRRSGSGRGLAGLAAVNRQLLAQALADDECTAYTLDIDATGIEAEKKQARMTYKGFKGYMPIVGHLAERGLILGDEFREGNASPGSGNLEFIQYCISQMPAGQRIKYLRADSAAYQAAVFNYCEEHEIEFAIGADLDKAVLAAIRNIPAGDWRDYQGGRIAETVHSMNETKESFRLIVVRRPYQQHLFDDAPVSEKYFVVATNRADENAEASLSWYNQRGQSSENQLKELKIGLGMERMPCGQFASNAMWFRIGVLAQNLFVLFKLKVLPESWRSCQIQTLRWRLYEVAGKVVHHGNRVTLKVRRYFYGLYKDIRRRMREYCFV
jgi:hypothetical protein